MNKKLMAILGTVAVSGVLLGTTAFATISGTSGYDIYKEAAKNTHAVQSVTPKTAITVTDNGDVLFKVDTLSEIDKASNAMSNNVTITSGDQKQTIDMYKQEGKTVVKTSESEVYNVMQYGEGWRHGKKSDGKHKEHAQKMEGVVDALTSSIQNYISLKEESNGAKEVTLQMSDNQISPVINALASVAVMEIGQDKGSKMRGHKDFIDPTFMANLQDKLPVLVDNIRVTQIDMKASINKDKLIEEQTQKVVIAGTDAEGNNHEIVVTVNVSFADFNNTVPDQVDLEGKQVKTINKADKFKHGR